MLASIIEILENWMPIEKTSKSPVFTTYWYASKQTKRRWKLVTNSWAVYWMYTFQRVSVIIKQGHYETVMQFDKARSF